MNTINSMSPLNPINPINSLPTDGPSLDMPDPKSAPGKDATVKKALKPGAFHGLLGQFGLATGRAKTDAEPQSKASAELPAEATLAQDGAQSSEIGKEDPSPQTDLPWGCSADAPALWAQMQWQTQSAQPSPQPQLQQAHALSDSSTAGVETNPAALHHTAQHKESPGHGGKSSSWATALSHVNAGSAGDVGNSGNASNAGDGSKTALEQALAKADPALPQGMDGSAPGLPAISSFAFADNLYAEQRRAVAWMKDEARTDPGTYSAQGLDMSTSANQTAASLGLNATIPVNAVAETAVANQVSVWVSQNVRSAELTLDGFQGEAVEVSISMVGKEATVAFRCDTEDTRDMLSRASDQLGTMLQSEGLVLANVSVGTSPQSQAQDQPTSQHPARAARNKVQAQVGSAIAKPTLNAAHRPMASASAVDLFV